MLSIELDDIRKNYSSTTTIRMSTTIAAGELFTLLGPSGCGKSTLLRIIAGFVAPTGGRVLFGDRDVTSVPPNKRDTGMVFQNYALFPHMTVAENIGYGLRARRVAKQDRGPRIADALAQVGLAGYADRRIDQLSGGQQQRVALARAVVIAPSVLLLDEPLSNLDAKLREETRTQIRRIQTEAGITSIYVTHDQAEAMAMSDRIAVLEAGRVHQIASPRTIYHRPATEFVARFIGRSNVVPAQVISIAGDTARVDLGDGAALTVPMPDFGPLTIGERLAVSLRPESLGFVAPDDSLFKGRIGSAEFTGATSTYTVICGELTLQVTVSDSVDRPRVGDIVGVGVTSGQPWLVRS